MDQISFLGKTASCHVARPVFTVFSILWIWGAVASAQELKSPIDATGTWLRGGRPPVRTAPLLTPWGREITPSNVHPEYPRPTLVRKEWSNLNGLWDWRNADRFSDASDGVPVPVLPDSQRSDAYDGRILVPFPVESALSGVGRPLERVLYRRFFVIPKHWPEGHRVLLHFGAVDWEAVVYLNGRFVGQHRGGYDSFSFDVTDFLTPSDGEPNELIVHVFDPTNHGKQPRGKQSASPSGIWYTPVSGLWQTVWLEPVAPSHLKSIRLSADAGSGVLTILPRIERPRSDLSLFAEAFDGDRVVAKAYGGTDGPLLLRFPKQDLQYWSPETPNLYQLRIRLLDKDVPIDQVGSYAAFRTVELTPNALGKARIRLNGRVLFQAGVLDQGYWPDGLYTAPSDQAIQSDIQVAKKLGFNLIRKHVKVEPERWYYWCDRLGMLVWQDMPNGDGRTPESQAIFREELRRMIEARSHHPSIVVWTLFNEGWGQHRTAEYVDLVGRLDPTRLIDNASGWTDFGLGQLNDHHQFPGPEAPPPDPRRASVIGSFGGLTLVPPETNLWTTETWGYRHVADSEALTRTYRSMHEEIRRLIREEGLSAAVFHQLADVEAECNGLVSYDRVLLKVDPDAFRRINEETIRYGSAAAE